MGKMFVYCGIYHIRNNKTGIRYIGSSKNIKERWTQHISYLNRGCHHNNHLQKAWKKYGRKSFSFEVLKLCCENDLLNEESEIVKSIPKKKLYNIAEVGRNSPSPKTYQVKDPKGEIITFTNLSKFCKDNDLNQGNLHLVIQGKRKVHKGYTSILGFTPKTRKDSKLYNLTNPLGS